MKMNGFKTLGICVAMVWFSSSGLAAEPAGLLKNNKSVMEVKSSDIYSLGSIEEILGSSMIILEKEFNVTPNTIFIDKKRHSIPRNTFKKGDQVLYQFDPSTSELILLQMHIPSAMTETPPEMKQEQGSTSTPQEKKDERQIKLMDGVYKN
jgi:hypothetical protein